MKRRELLLVAAVAAGAAAAAEQSPVHHHDASGSPLLDAALQCVKAGEVCQAHCLDLFAEGDNSVAACARAVALMKPVCLALSEMAAQKSPLLPRYAAVANDVCQNCEAECRKHAEKHAACKACMDSCAACAQECARIAA
jgi:Cys-rich four helix bundle protein (predicted Tat secretion target)